MQEEKSLELSLQLCEVKSFGVDMLLCFLWGPFFCQCAAFCLVHLLVSCSLLSYFTSLWFILSSSPLSNCIFATLSSQMFSFPLWFCYSFFFFFFKHMCLYTLHYHFMWEMCAKHKFLFFAHAYAKCFF